MPLDLDKEKKKNVRLAIGVAAIGILFFAVLYASMFALMFLRPGLVFSMMPIPAISKNIISVNDKLYVASREIDFSQVSFEDKKQPDEKFLLGMMDGDKSSKPQEIKPYHSYAGGNNKVYFFSKGLFRTFDGNQWIEVKTDAIGKNPKAAAGREGIWVLSEKKNAKALNHIKEDEIYSVPLPEGYTENKETCTSSANLILVDDNLHLIWTSEKLLYFARYDGRAWQVSEPSECRGNIKVISDNKRIYLFREQYDEQPGISLVTYENGEWDEPKELDIHGLFFDWSPLIHKGKLLLFVRSFFKEELYAIENGNAVNPARLGSSFRGRDFFSKISIVILLTNLVFFIFIYLLSAFIRRFKLRLWKADSAEYEFASLFRRFLAKFIDSIIIMLPPASVVIYFIFDQKFFENPLKICLLGLLIFGYLIIAGFLYHWLLEGLYGKTLGKKICGIVVLKDDFSRCGLLAGFLRNLMRLVDNFFYYLVGVVSLTGTLKWQRLGDVVAGTVVVREKKA